MAFVKVPPHARAVRVRRGHRFAAYPRCWADYAEDDVMGGLAWLVWLALTAPPGRVGSAAGYGTVEIRFAGNAGAEAYQALGAVQLHSASARVEETGRGRRFLSVCLSDLEDVNCSNARSTPVNPGAVVLIVGATLAPGVEPGRGEWKDLGVILRTGHGTYTAQGMPGTLRLETFAKTASGATELHDERLTVAARFERAVVLPMLRTGSKTAARE